MLWHKAWLETRWRFVAAMVTLTIVSAGTVYDYIATQQLLPQLTAASPAPAAEATGLAAALRDAIDVQKNFRGFTWYQTFRGNLTQLGVFFAMLLGCGGMLHETSKRSALFIYPDDDLAVVVLTNLQGSQPERMLDQIASFFVPDIKNVVAKTP